MHRSPCSPCKTPLWSRKMPERSLNVWQTCAGAGRWQGPEEPWREEPTLKQVSRQDLWLYWRPTIVCPCLKCCTSWKSDPCGSSLWGADAVEGLVQEELMEKNCLPWEKPHAGARGGKTPWDELTMTHFQFPCATGRGGGATQKGNISQKMKSY